MLRSHSKPLFPMTVWRDGMETAAVDRIRERRRLSPLKWTLPQSTSERRAKVFALYSIAMRACVAQRCLQTKKDRSQRSRDLILGRATLPATEGLVHLPAGLALTNNRTELAFERFSYFRASFCLHRISRNVPGYSAPRRCFVVWLSGLSQHRRCCLSRMG